MKPYYQDNSVAIYHGDCREILQTIPKVDVTLTDPPYEMQAHTLQRRVKRSHGVMEVEPLHFAPMDEITRDAVSKIVAEKTKRWILVFCQIEAAPIWRLNLEKYGSIYKRTCIWVKPDGMPQYSGDRPGMGYETFLAMHSKGRSKWNGGGRVGVFTHNKNEGNGRTEHPTTKPVRLMSELVSLFTNESETVLDPFMGSGTTLRAAKDLGRKAIGIEIEEKYCEIAARRMAQEVLL